MVQVITINCACIQRRAPMIPASFSFTPSRSLVAIFSTCGGMPDILQQQDGALIACALRNCNSSSRLEVHCIGADNEGYLAFFTKRAFEIQDTCRLWSSKFWGKTTGIL